MQLKDKVVVITGAGRGIGKAIALSYAAHGVCVVCAARTVTEIERVAQQIKESGGKAIAVPTDVTNLESVQRLFKRTHDTFGAVDLLVINAGVNKDRKLVEAGDPHNWADTIQVNLIGAYYCAHSAIPYMKTQGGKIITIGSGVGHKGRPGSSAYACSKAGLWMMTRVLAQELWKYDISVNELIPGPVHTSMDNDEQSSVFSIDGEWVKEPEDVTPMALFLAQQPDIGPTAQSFSLMRRDC
ncbi:SDR family NAD(P)-dependent oxidoreductase [Sporolactobacillus terrae]|uniref:SDR family NAD(P)-dependent oxidoreductase n=1 Tax=Sporolactobacillus terrae TaxID=269673 RepID=UPI00111AE54D|nr:SDR family oxidoreductase [Sporolactobacillus terrae]